MISRPHRTTVRRATSLALFAALVAGATALAPTSVASPGSVGEGRPGLLPTDAVVARPPAGALPRAPLLRADAGNVVDIAFVFPAALVSQADIGGLSGLRSKFIAQVADANTAFSNSGIPVQLRYVGARQVAAATTKDLGAMLKQLGTPGDGLYDEALALREETHADLVSLWVSSSVPVGQTCGMGNIGGTAPTTDPEYSAWTVLFYTDCIDRFRVFAHEIGHNFSGNHDTGAAQPPTGGKPYARGYTDPAHKFISVMAYYDACFAVNVTDCVRVPYFSGPNVTTAQGYPTGSAAADNVRAISEQAPAVANYRQSQIYSAAPTITGRLNHGKTLLAGAPGWAPGNLTFSYQWAADGVPIPGATGATFALGKAQVGTSVSVTVTGAAPYYTPVAAVSAPTAEIGKRLFRKTHRPRILGAARPGGVLRAVVKSWKPGTKVTYRFRWFRNGKAIKGARGSTYRVARKDRGKKISVQVTGKRKGYEPATLSSKRVRIRP